MKSRENLYQTRNSTPKVTIHDGGKNITLSGKPADNNGTLETQLTILTSCPPDKKIKGVLGG